MVGEAEVGAGEGQGRGGAGDGGGGRRRSWRGTREGRSWRWWGRG